jgi:pimeloyl-ACP methyl ester carboxylesterase
MNVSDFVLRKLLFQPTLLAADYRYQFEHPFEELWFEPQSGIRLNALLFRTQNAVKKGVILYFHGNRGNLQRWGAMHQAFTQLGYDFLAPDYRGYGKSGGQPDEPFLFADALYIYDWLATHYEPENIILYGRSLGSGMASYLAARVQARFLILETPFDTIHGMIASHVGRDALPMRFSQVFPNHTHVAQTNMPVLIFHGTRDRVVPYASAVKLKESLKPSDQFITIQGGAHNNLETFVEYQTYINAWLCQ